MSTDNASATIVAASRSRFCINACLGTKPVAGHSISDKKDRNGRALERRAGESSVAQQKKVESFVERENSRHQDCD
jgi:hypothetical protein